MHSINAKDGPQMVHFSKTNIKPKNGNYSVLAFSLCSRYIVKNSIAVTLFCQLNSLIVNFKTMPFHLMFSSNYKTLSKYTGTYLGQDTPPPTK